MNDIMEVAVYVVLQQDTGQIVRSGGLLVRVVGNREEFCTPITVKNGEEVRITRYGADGRRVGY